MALVELDSTTFTWSLGWTRPQGVKNVLARKSFLEWEMDWLLTGMQGEAFRPLPCPLQVSQPQP